jgi:two-component sensor histidine kinase
MNNYKFPAQLSTFIRNGLRVHSAAAFVFAILCVAVATVARLAIDLIVPHADPFVTYFPAIMIATLAGGWVAGMLVFFSATIVAYFLFVPPHYFEYSSTLDNAVNIALFAFATLLILWVSEQFRRIIRQLNEEEHYRQIVVDELGHRVKNNFATIYAILRHELRGHPEIWDSVAGRLRALSAADDFLVKGERGSINIRQIVAQELASYDVSRISFTGDNVDIHGKLAVVLSLIVHELATNAAKYGALSSPQGRLDISWRMDANDIALDWVESGGPPVNAPERRSFGSNLIEHGLAAFGGNAKIAFAITGVVCRIRFPQPTAKPNTTPQVRGIKS